MRTALLDKGLRLVPTVGFHGAEDALLPQLNGIQFPRGVAIELVERAVVSSNYIAKQHLDTHCSKGLSVGGVGVVYEGLRAKLAGISPYAGWWHEAVALELQPQNAPFAAQRLAELTDDICFYAERARVASVLRAGGAEVGTSTGVPLSSGPHQSPLWYVDRAQVASTYMLVLTSMMGEGGDLKRSNELLVKLCRH
jgi:hypothetical protein